MKSETTSDKSDVYRMSAIDFLIKNKTTNFYNTTNKYN